MSKKSGDNKKISLRDAMLEDLARSSLTARDAEILKLTPLNATETDDFVGEPRASYRIPYFNLDGKLIAYSRVRFLENKRGRFSTGGGSFRYSQPANSSPHVYFPPYVDWRALSTDTSKTILITEGEKKAALACKLGIPCIALGGVYAFKSSKRLWDLIPEMQEITWKDRTVEICFDADVMYKSEVRQALAALAFTLTQEQGPEEINFVFLDAETAGPKTGLDDFLAAHGADTFKSLPRSSYTTSAKVQLINQRVAYVENAMRFYDLKIGKYFKNLAHVREALMYLGEILVDGKRSIPVVDVWARSATRRAVTDIVYLPGKPELCDDGSLNVWTPPTVRPRAATPKRWLEMVRYIMRTEENMQWLLQWLAYPVQHPGTKLSQAVFVYGARQGVGKTFIVDPVMEFIYGPENFHRLQNNALNSQFNGYAARRQFVVTNEVWLPDFRDRRAAMSMLKDTITRERVTINEKFQPEVTYLDFCNYYFTSNHADALILERDDRRFFVVEAPDVKLEQADYYELDVWLREHDGAGAVLHYLQHAVDTTEFDPRGDARMTEYKRQVIELSRDALGEYGERVIEDPEALFQVNGALPDLELFRAEDLLKNFEVRYPRYRFNVTVNRMARILRDERLEKRNVRITTGAPLVTLYAVFNRAAWRGRRNRDWAAHYADHAARHRAARRKLQ